ncbi:MAG: hypothetical protein MJ065_00975 [Oscillospiraceae bacterium]|nr:hypothetical protein [Oscillospiraceae bacterium]
MPLNAQALIAELLSRSLRADAEGFTMTKPLGVTTVSIRADGEPLPGSLHAAPEIEQNAAAVRIVAQEYPELKITYPQTVISECEDSQSGQDPHTVRRIRTDAHIEVPSEFVRQHNGSDYQELIQKDAAAQLESLCTQICKKIRRHELRTAELFSAAADNLTASFRITEETVSSDIWMIPLSRYGFYPLLWDTEICGMAVLLSRRLTEIIPAARGTQERIAVTRDDAFQSCSVTIHYSLKQD